MKDELELKSLSAAAVPAALNYTGVMCERKTRSLMRRGVMMLYEGFREAMAWYEKAADLRPKGIDDPILRWNSCLRTIQRKHLEPAPPEQELPLE